MERYSFTQVRSQKSLLNLHNARTFFLEGVNCAVETMKAVTKSVKFLCVADQ